MNILAIDTATERCSAALLVGEQMCERSAETPRAHAELILPMVADLLKESGMRLADVDAIAYGRGPGAFTGVRIAVSVAQGLAFGAGKPTIGISNLAAVAQQVATQSTEVLVCMDARMGEVYWCRYALRPGEQDVQPLAPERVSAPQDVQGDRALCAGTGFAVYPVLAEFAAACPVRSEVLPHAREIARLAVWAMARGEATAPAHAAPIYLRDNVAKKMAER